jgi:integrase/recombinase XerD
LPSKEEIEKALAVTTAIYNGEGEGKADTRPHLLLTLLLQTGIKKSEAMAIIPNHIDTNDADEPLLFIRYANPRLRYKERKLYLEPEWLAIFDAYLQEYKPTDTLFTCTARNLEYVLSDVCAAAGLAKGSLSFENLRWISALHDWNAKVEPDEIRQKLGLSKITWRETRSKLKQLVEGRDGS